MSLNNGAIKRIAKDVKYILNNEVSLSMENIYYKHDEENVFKGYALIIGQKDTPYGYGYYFFEFDFPDNYPFSPPLVRYLTNDGSMRFNPNLYANGKVCLSVLNTWSGESWTSCQSINSILFTLSTVLCENPLLNEPGIQKTNIEVEKYNYLVTYKNIEFAIAKIIEYVNKDYISNCDLINNVYNSLNVELMKDDIGIMCKFKSIINKTFTNNKKYIIEYIDNNKIKYSKFISKENDVNDISDKDINIILNKNKHLTTKTSKKNLYISIYSLSYFLEYEKLYNLIESINY